MQNYLIIHLELWKEYKIVHFLKKLSIFYIIQLKKLKKLYYNKINPELKIQISLLNLKKNFNKKEVKIVLKSENNIIKIFTKLIDKKFKNIYDQKYYTYIILFNLFIYIYSFFYHSYFFIFFVFFYFLIFMFSYVISPANIFTNVTILS